MEVKKTEITRHFDNGAVRGDAAGRGRASLLPAEAVNMVARCFGGYAGHKFPLDALHTVSKVFEAGASKYEERNWEKGIPLSAFVDSAWRHYRKKQRGWIDEPHGGQFCWNVLCLLQTFLWKDKLPDAVFDLPLIDLSDIRQKPLPTIRVIPREEHLHADFAIGCMFGFVYGKDNINLVCSAAHALAYLQIAEDGGDQE